MKEKIIAYFAEIAANLDLPAPEITFHTELKPGDEEANAGAYPSGKPLQLEYWPPFFNLRPGQQLTILRYHTLCLLNVCSEYAN